MFACLGRRRKKVEPVEQTAEERFATYMDKYQKLIDSIFYSVRASKINYTLELHMTFQRIRSELDHILDEMKTPLQHYSDYQQLEAEYCLKMYEAHIDDNILISPELEGNVLIRRLTTLQLIV